MYRASEVTGYASGIRCDTADCGGCDSGLSGQSDIAEPGYGQAESTAVDGSAGVVKSAGGSKVVDIGPVAGGQDDGVDVLMSAVGPDDPGGGEAFEHPSLVGPPGCHRGGVASVVEYSASARGPSAER
jgi:hypothetical protein